MNPADFRAARLESACAGSGIQTDARRETGSLRERERLSQGKGTALKGRENGSVRFIAAAKNIHSGRYEHS